MVEISKNFVVNLSFTHRSNSITYKFMQLKMSYTNESLVIASHLNIYHHCAVVFFHVLWKLLFAFFASDYEYANGR